jgi:hypothetical protein
VLCLMLQALRISCKRTEYNLYEGQTYDKFESIPLASKGWHHRKSRGDYFTIQKYREVSKYFYAHTLFIVTLSMKFLLYLPAIAPHPPTPPMVSPPYRGGGVWVLLRP